MARRNRILYYFHNFLILITKPFHKAESLEIYSTNGYRYIFGGFLILIIIILWHLDYLGVPLSKLPSDWANSIKSFLLAIGLKDMPDLPMIFLIVNLYILLYLVKSTRLIIGRIFADLFFKLTNKLIYYGELCIKYRGFTTCLIIFVFGFLAWGISSVVNENKTQENLQLDFNYWMKSVEDFIQQSPLSKAEYQGVACISTWKQDFDKLSKLPNGYQHPAPSLYEMLKVLYGQKEGNTPWNVSLKDREPRLKNILNSCNHRPEIEMYATEARAWILMNLLMGRIYVRLERGEKKGLYLMEAMRYFKILDSENFKNNLEINRYGPAFSNGKGTVYANALSAYLRKEHIELSQICQNPSDCAYKAIIEYEEAGKDPLPCSFQNKRRINNTADLFLRLGLKYSLIREERFEDIIYHWIKSPTLLADKLEAQVKIMMDCNDSEPFIATTFMTTAQVYAVCALLRKQAGDEKGANRDIQAAGVYLRLVYSFDKANYSKWDFSCFCHVAGSQELEQIFRSAISNGLEGLPSIDIDDLMGRLTRKGECDD